MTEHPADEVLAAFAEGEDHDAALSEHVRGCAVCAERVQAYRGAAAVLACATPLSRRSCPPRESLAARRSLAGAEASRLSDHLDACPLCRSDLADLAALEAAPDLVTVVQGQLRLLAEWGRGVLKLIESSLPSAPEPALAPVRGPAAPESALRVEAPFGEGVLALSWAVGQGGVDLRAEAQGDAPRTFRLTLGVGETVLESRGAEEGAVTLVGIEPGAYRVAVYAPRDADPSLLLDLELEAM